MPNNLTYAKSGVNIRSADKFVKFISKITSKQSKNLKNNNIGNFGSITKLPSNLKNVHLVAATDGVGTKIEIANFQDLINQANKEKEVELKFDLERNVKLLSFYKGKIEVSNFKLLYLHE